MTPRLLLLPTLCAVAALAAACDDSVRISSTHSETGAKGVLKVVEALQCPQTVGSLTRKGSAQAEGRVCTYIGPKGAEVSLRVEEIRTESSHAPARAATAQRVGRRKGRGVIVWCP